MSKKFVTRFTDGSMLFEEDGVLCLYDWLGEPKTKSVYTSIEPLEHEPFSIVRNGFFAGVIDKEGKEIISPNEFEDILKDKDGYLFEDRPYPIYKQYGKYGYLDGERFLLTDAIFDEAREFNNDYAAVRIGEKWTFINTNGEECIDPIFTSVEDFFALDDEREDSMCIAPVKDDSGKLGFFDGIKVIIPCEYEKFFPLGLNYLSVKNSNENWVVYHIASSLEIEEVLICDGALDFSRDFAFFRKGKNAGFLRKDGKIVISPEDGFDNIDNDGGIIKAKKDSYWYIFDNDGHPLSEEKYTEIQHFYGDIAIAKKRIGFKNVYGFLTSSGKELCKFKYDDAERFTDDGYGTLIKGCYTYYIDRNGKIYTKKH